MSIQFCYKGFEHEMAFENNSNKKKFSRPHLYLATWALAWGRMWEKNIISILLAIDSQATISYPGINQCTFSPSQCTQPQGSQFLCLLHPSPGLDTQ